MATPPNDKKKRAATKAHVKKLQKAHKKLKLQLQSMEKTLSSPLMIWHRR
jgi:hypothetical protein